MQYTKEYSMLQPEILNKKLFIIDVDGTIYIDDQFIPGSLEFLDYLRKNNKKYLFLTNNSSKSKATHLQLLNSKGLKVEEDNLLTSNEQVAIFLNENYKNKNVLYMGTYDSAKEMKNLGIDIILPFDSCLNQKIDILVLAYDTSMNYEKLKNFCYFLRKDTLFISTHADYNCPSLLCPLPDNGAMLELLYASTGRRPDYIFGKPSSFAVDIILNKYNISKEDTIIIGDRLYTDIKMGNDNQIETILVLSGESNRQDLEKYDFNPNYIVENIGEILKEVI